MAHKYTPSIQELIEEKTRLKAIRKRNKVERRQYRAVTHQLRNLAKEAV
jgi:hypothetical protein